MPSTRVVRPCDPRAVRLEAKEIGWFFGWYKSGWGKDAILG
ncbi:MAG: hypothetical protein U0231_02405 [Nitrospiraceae bacterium]